MRLVDADALIKALVRKEPFNDCARVVIAECMEEVRHAPSIEPERKKGIWIHVHPLQSDDPGAYMCSECRTGNWEIDPESYFFCPYCGADMRGEQDD